MYRSGIETELNISVRSFSHSKKGTAIVVILSVKTELNVERGTAK